MRLRCLSPAKINLGLEILGKRPDGYHEIRTILQMVDLCDEVSVGFSDEMRLVCSDPAVAGPENLAWRAGERWRDERDPEHRSLAIDLVKRIPAAAGLGGASSNGASVLILAEELARTAGGSGLLSPGERLDRLGPLAAGLGSDVPFFLGEPAAFASGRGEHLEPVAPLSDEWIVLITPALTITGKTAVMYGALDPERDFTDGATASKTRRKLTAGEVLEGADLFNAFARPLCAHYPDMERIAEIVGFYADGRYGLSGAGPTWYALVGDEASASNLAEAMRAELPEARIVTARPLAGPIEIHE
ncbi:MAG: 4-(cytidine 5'-diphospho)-2-C-methyl-D-erythritol kinase [Thermomicrobiales bacterium]|nr:4-(cytidine 5'-diphospho)-2-C-methyl-D-erythritol kinase [Thermomicrobiales bacterium]